MLHAPDQQSCAPEGRGLRQVGLKIGPHTLRVATSHLESPIPRRPMCQERQQQCTQVRPWYCFLACEVPLSEASRALNWIKA